MSRHIVIVEDELAIAENYRDAFIKQHYTVSIYNNREDALKAIQHKLPDLALIDIGLGEDFDGGFTLCQELRNLDQSLAIVFLTARTTSLDQVAGLRLGADDYISKDEDIEVVKVRVASLFARIEARMSAEPATSIIEVDDLSIDIDRQQSTYKDKDIDLTLTEFWLLLDLVKRPGHVRSKEQLMQAAKLTIGDSSFRSHITRLRKKFTNIDPDFDLLVTEYGSGYRWIKHTS